MSTMHNAYILPGWTIVSERLTHPTDPAVAGDLARNDHTGIYALLAAGTSSSVPQGWARDQDPTITTGRPVGPDGRGRAVRIYAPAGMLDALDAEAARRGRSRSGAIVEAVRLWLAIGGDHSS
jgi:hypothetical protein